MFTRNYEIKYYDKNMKGVVKEAALLNVLQEIATLNANSLSFGQEFTEENSIAWAVVKYRLELNEPLKDIDNLTLKTEARGLSRLFAYRNFEIYIQDKFGGRASSAWVLIDMTTRRIQPVKKLLPNMPDLVPNETDLNYEKIVLPEKFDSEKEFEVLFDDIDTNGHANNSNYIHWAVSSLPTAFRENHAIKNVDIAFKKEARLGAKMVSQSAINGNETIHLIKNSETGEALCEFKIEWFNI